MRKIVTLLSWFLFVIALGACNTSSAITEIPVIVQPTEMETILPTPTAPIIPTVNPLKPTAIAEFFATQEAITVTPELTYTPNYEDCSLEESALGNWALCNTSADPITIVSKSNKLWHFSYKTYYGKDVKNPCTRLNYITSDESYLYFSLVSECMMSEPGFDLSIGVFRWNLINGEVSEILKTSYDFVSEDGNYYSLSISPTGRRMAYIYLQKSPLFLNILDLQTGKDHSFPLEEKYRSGGMFSWSEDGTKLAFKLESKKDNDYFISMVFVDLLKDDSMVTFIRDKDPSWISSHLEVMDKGVNIFPIGETPLYYDIETGILSPVSQ